MIDITMTTRIDRSVEEVFAYVSDTANEPAWNADLLEASRASATPLGKGTRFTIRNKPSMGISEGTAEVVEYEPNRRHVLQVDYGPGKMQPVLTHLFEPNGNGTNITRRVRFELPGMMRLMQPMVRMMAKRRNRDSLASLKRIMEQGGP